MYEIGQNDTKHNLNITQNDSQTLHKQCIVWQQAYTYISLCQLNCFPEAIFYLRTVIFKICPISFN